MELLFAREQTLQGDEFLFCVSVLDQSHNSSPNRPLSPEEYYNASKSHQSMDGVFKENWLKKHSLTQILISNN